MKLNYTLAFALVFTYLQLYCQDNNPSFLSKDFRSLELKIGGGKLQPQMAAIDLNYQHNVFKHLSLVSVSQISFSAWARNPDKYYLVVNYFHAVQTIGLGATVGGQRFNTGLFLLGGARLYHSKAMVEGLHQPEMTTDRMLAESGLLCSLKFGKRKVYFAAQFYLPITPFNMKFFEKNATLTLGAGFRFNKGNFPVFK